MTVASSILHVPPDVTVATQEAEVDIFESGVAHLLLEPLWVEHVVGHGNVRSLRWLSLGTLEESNDARGVLGSEGVGKAQF